MALVGCVPPSLGEEFESQGAASTVTVYDVQRGLVDSGTTVRLRDLVATTARGPDDRVFFAQDPAGGPESGIRIELEHPTPGVEVAVGDTVSVRGTVLLRYGERYLMVEDMDGLATGPGEPVVPTPVAGSVSWGSWNAVVVTLAEATAEGCGDARGAVPLDLGLALDPWHEPVSTGDGDVFTGLTGLVVGQNYRWELRLRPGDGPAAVAEAGGCVVGLSALRAAWPVGRVRIEDAVSTAVYDGGFFLQQDGLGLEVVTAAGAPALAVDTALSVEGVADTRDGRGVLRLDAPGLVELGEAEAAVAVALSDEELLGEDGVFDLDGQPNPRWDGALVSLAGVELQGAVAAGRIATDVGLVVDDALFEGLPASGLWDLRGVLRVVGGEVRLLPRDAADLVESGG